MKPGLRGHDRRRQTLGRNFVTAERQPVHTAGRAAAAIAYAVAMGADPSPAGELAAQTERRWSQQQLQAALDIRR
jgi:hypothetical protein